MAIGEQTNEEAVDQRILPDHDLADDFTQFRDPFGGLADAFVQFFKGGLHKNNTRYARRSGRG